MTGPDHARFAEWDAAFVLGGLSPAERRDFEDHVEECEKCRASVAELSALPGLLGRIDNSRAFALLEDAEAESSVGPPTDLVARIQRRERRERVRRRLWMGVGLTAAAAVAATFALVLPPILTPDVQPTFAAELTSSDDNVPIQASVELTSLAWGTRIDMDCTYLPIAQGPDGGYGPVPYSMWIVSSDGEATSLSTWSAAPDGTVTVSAGTALDLAQIARVEIRVATGDQALLSAEI